MADARNHRSQHATLEASQPPSDVDQLKQVTASIKSLQLEDIQAQNANAAQAEPIRQELASNKNQNGLKELQTMVTSLKLTLLRANKIIENQANELHLQQRQYESLMTDTIYLRNQIALQNEQMPGTEYGTLTPPLSEDEQCRRPDESINQSPLRPASRISRGSNSDRNGSLRNTNRKQAKNLYHIPLQHGEHRIKKRPRRRKLPLERRELQDPTISSTTSPSRGDQEIRRPYKAWTLKMLNIQKYNPERTDLITHFEQVTRILEEVDVRPESQKIRLLVASFPPEMDHYERAISKHKRKNYNTFSKELIRIMNDKVRTGSEKFLNAYRRRGEDILRFFFRLCDLYKSSKGIMGNEWQDEPVHTSHIYTKLHGSLYEDEKSELERKLDRYVERGTLTVARLKKELIEINKMASDKINAETSSRHALLHIDAEDIEQHQQNEIEKQEETGEQIMDYTETSSDEE